MRTIISHVLLLASLSLFAQEEIRSRYSVDIQNDFFYGDLSNVRFKTTSSAYGIRGSRFVFDEFQPSDVYFSNWSLAEGKLMNYDCYMDQLVYSDGEDRYVLNNFQVDYVEFHVSEDSSVFFKRMIAPEDKDIVFMEILLSGARMSLYKRYTKKLVMNDDQPTYNWDDKYANEYIAKESYYLRMPGGEELTPLPPNKKAFLKSSGKYRESLKAYIKAEKISFRDEPEMIKLILFYDGLIDGRN